MSSPESKRIRYSTDAESTANASPLPEKQCEPDDPMELHVQGMSGDPIIMLDSLIEEFARMGWDAKRIEVLFHDPFYQAMYDLNRRLGIETIQVRIENVLNRHGVMRVREQYTLADGIYHDGNE